MWDVVGNPKDRFSHNEAHIAVTSKNDTINQGFNFPLAAFKIEFTVVIQCLL